jgi:HEAT repeat protein
MPILSPAEYATLSAKELLQAVANGEVGFDHAFFDAFLRDREAALDALDAFVAADHEDDRVDIEEQIFELYRHLRDPRAVPFYMLLLRAQLDGVQDDLIEAFAEIGEPAVQPLLDLYEEVEEEEGGEIAFVLAAMQIRDERITKLLLDRLEYDAQDAAVCLGLHRDPAAKPALEKLLEEVSQLPDPGLIKSDVEEAIERVSRDEPEPERPPFNIYEQYTEFTPPFFEVMDAEESLQWLASPDRRVRLAVAESLEDVDISDEVAASLPARALAEADLTVRCALWKCLLQTDLSEELVQAVKARFDDPAVEPLERATLAIVLARAQYNDALKSRILDFYGQPELRPLAMEAMWYTNDAEFLPLIETHLEDEDMDVRRAAILGVGFFVDTASASRLIPSMKVESLRSDAIYSYALAHPGEVSRITAQKVLKHVDQVAGGLTRDETELAMSAIDLRLSISGGRPFFAMEEHGHDH